MGQYASAQVCENGHLVSASLRHAPDASQGFCAACGAATITACPACGMGIRGEYVEDEGGFSITPYRQPLYCYSCGAPFPWTRRALAAARGIVDDEDQLTDTEKEKLKESMPDILANNPGTQLAVLRVRKAISKVGKFSADALRQFVFDYGSEEAVALLRAGL